MTTLFLVLFALCSISQLAACFLENRRWRAFNKPMLLLTLTIWYGLSVAQMNPLILAGLLLSLLGDILLIFRGLFKIGGMAFFGAHLCYLAAFWHNIRLERPIWLLAAVGYGILLFLAFHALRKSMGKRSLVMAVSYLCALSVMSLSALLQWATLGGVPSAAVLVGSLLFLASDCLIALREFRKDLKIPKAHFLVMLTYIPAQFLIVWGMSRIGIL